MLTRKNLKRGFALIEVIVVAAILITTFSIGGVSAIEIDRNMKQMDADATARRMYVVAQENLSKLKAMGYDITQLKDAVITNQPSDYNLDGENYSDHPLYYTTSATEGVKELLFDGGGIEDEILDDNWIVEFDPATGLVASAFYIDYDAFKELSAASLTSGVYNSDDLYQLRQSSKNRIKYYTELDKGEKHFIGYYGNNNKAVSVADIVNKKDKCDVDIKVTNNIILEICYEVYPPENYPTDTVKLELSYVGETSHAVLTKTILISPADKDKNSNIPNFRYEVLTDKNGNVYYKIYHTIDTLDGVEFGDKESGSEFDKFIKGENVIVSAVASVPSANTNTSSDIKTKTFNSLFGSLESGLEYENTVTINNGRHLQNLNDVADSLNIERVIQTSDIEMSGINFEALNCPSIVLYEGNNYTISNLNVTKGDKNGNAGLFGTFGTGENNAKIQNLKLVNPVVNDKESRNSGALIGESKDLVIVDNVSIIFNNNDNPSIVAIDNAGGIIGLAGDNNTITGSKVIMNLSKGDFSDSDTNVVIKATNGCAGGIVGKAGTGLSITKSCAATVVKGNTYAGGLVGYADEGANFYYSYADCYLNAKTVGGIAGTANMSKIKDCYAAGMTFGSVGTAYGLIGGHVHNASSVYTVFEVAAAGKSYSTFNIATTIDRVWYISTLGADINVLGTKEKTPDVLTNQDNTRSYLDNCFNILGNNSYPYNYNNLGLSSYPYPTLDGLPHYGDWASNVDSTDICGVFYWEKEIRSGKVEYHYYMIGSSGESYDNLCINHDDGGVIVEYGYGYAIKTGTTSNVVKWDADSVKCDGDGNILATPYKGIAEQIEPLIENKLKKDYNVICYKTASSTVSNALDTGDLCLYNPISTTKDNPVSDFLGQRTYTSVSIQPNGKGATYTFSFCPFFAADIVFGNGIDYNNTYNTVIKTPTAHQIRSIDQLQYLNWNSKNYNCHTLSTWTNYQQFPFLNSFVKEGGIAWYGESVTKYVNFDSSIYNQTHDIDATDYNCYTPIAAMGSVANNKAHWDIIDPIKYEIDDKVDWESNLYVYNWFGSEFDGQTYLIKNLDISSSAYSVGLFGTTVGARLNNIIMLSDNNSTITKEAGKSNVMSDYFLGGLVGLACDSTTDFILTLTDAATGTKNLSSTIYNCAIGGYKIVDKTAHATTYNRKSLTGALISSGGSAVGGLVGATSIRIENCSAVVDIEINSPSVYGITAVGGLVGSASGSVFPAIVQQALVKLGSAVTQIAGVYDSYASYINKCASVANCYTGGSINVVSNGSNIIYSNVQKIFKGFYIGGVVGSNKNVSINNIYQYDEAWNHSITLYNCYSYMDLTQPVNNANVYSIGTMFGSCVTPVWQKVLTDNYDNYNFMVDCYYYGNPLSYEDQVNFIKSESYLVKDVHTSLNKSTICFYCSDTLGVGYGVPSISYNQMALQKRSAITTYTYASGTKSYNSGSNNTTAYPFKPVIKRGNDYVHVGDWPAGTKIVLNDGVMGRNKIVAYIGKGENVSYLEGYIKAKLYNTPNKHNFGYYINNSLFVDNKGEIVESSTYQKNNLWTYGTGTKNYTDYLSATAKWGYIITLKSPYLAGATNGTLTFEYIMKNDKDVPATIDYVPERDGYTYLGWFLAQDTSPAYGTDKIKTGRMTFNEDGTQTLYAGWSFHYDSLYIEIDPKEENFKEGNKYLIIGADGDGNQYSLSVGDGVYKKGNLQYYKTGSTPVKVYTTTVSNKYIAYIFPSGQTGWTYSNGALSCDKGKICNVSDLKTAQSVDLYEMGIKNSGNTYTGFYYNTDHTIFIGGKHYMYIYPRKSLSGSQGEFSYSGKGSASNMYVAKLVYDIDFTTYDY